MDSHKERSVEISSFAKMGTAAPVCVLFDLVLILAELQKPQIQPRISRSILHRKSNGAVVILSISTNQITLKCERRKKFFYVIWLPHLHLRIHFLANVYCTEMSPFNALLIANILAAGIDQTDYLSLWNAYDSK